MNKVMKKQIGGQHYKTNAIQPWDIIDIFNLNFYEGNALKYLLRRKGNRIEDLEKCKHYIEKEIVNHSPDSTDEEDMKKYIEECFDDVTVDDDGEVIVTPHSNSEVFHLNASEALYGFAGWLTSRDKVVFASASHDAGIWAELVSEFIQVNNLPEVRSFEWGNHLIHPKEKSNDTRETSVEGIKGDAENPEEMELGASIGRTSEWKDTIVPTGGERLQTSSDSNTEECSARCDTSSLVTEGPSNDNELSQCKEAFKVTEVRPDNSGRSPQVGRRVSEILNDLERVEKTVEGLRHDIQLGDINSRNLCQPLSNVGTILKIAMEKIRNLQ